MTWTHVTNRLTFRYVVGPRIRRAVAHGGLRGALTVDLTLPVLYYTDPGTTGPREFASTVLCDDSRAGDGKVHLEQEQDTPHTGPGETSTIL